MGFILSREAARDLEEIEDYTARKWGDKQAEKYLKEILQAFKKLSANPSPGRARADIPPAFLIYEVGSHVIIYRYNHQLEILNILHPAMDIAVRMSDALTRLTRKN